MIEKLDPNKPIRVEPTEKFDLPVYGYFPHELIEKINELIEAINRLEENQESKMTSSAPGSASATSIPT